MDTQTLAIRHISPETNSSGMSKRVNPDSPHGRQHQAASPTTGQTRPQSTPRNGGLQNGSKDPGLEEEPAPSKRSSQTSTGSSVVPVDLYPLSGFLRSVLGQEKALWERNEILLKSLKSKTSI